MAFQIEKYGWRRDLPDHRDLKFKAKKDVVKSLPPVVDNRGTMPAVFDQGQLGSCTSNATAGQIWALAQNKALIPSRLFIYYNSRKLEGTTGSDSGASIRDSIKSVVRWGYAPETDWPYDISKFKKAPPKNAYNDAVKDKISKYQSVSQDPNSIKAALVTGDTVNFGFTVYESFESDAVTQTGIVPMPQPNETVLGGHAVLLVGYDDSKNWYIARNSWGAGWGDKGYFYMPYAYVHNHNLASDFWVITGVPT